MAVKMEQGHFIIDGEKVFLYGGELHYFRVPRDEWSQRLDLLIESGCNLVSTYIPWALHEFEEGVFDFTGSGLPESDLKAFIELVKEKGLYCIVRPGPYIMAEVRYEGIPEWLLENNPDMIAKTMTGEDHPTKVVSYHHPVFLERTKKWYQEVNRILAPQQIDNGGPIIMYQLCNEIGMLHWVSNTADYSDVTIGKFKSYLEETYTHIAEWNATYDSHFESFDHLIKSVRQDGTHVEGFYTEWAVFFRHYIKDYVGILRGYAKETGITVPYIVNVHGFKDYSVYSRGVDYPIGLSQLYLTSEFDDTVLAGDFYPGHIGYDTYHDLVISSEFTKAVSKADQPLFSAEFQSGRLADRPRVYPQDLSLNTRTCVAHDMNALNYYMFAAGENPKDIGVFGRRHEWQAPIDSKGNTRPNYNEAQHLGKMLQVIGKDLLSTKKQTQTFVGFNPNDYMTEVVEKDVPPLIKDLISKRERFSYDGIVRLLTAANIHFNAVDLLKPIDPVKQPSLWVFSTAAMAETLQMKLVDYVAEGGKLVLYPEVPSVDEKGNACTLLKDRLELGDAQLIDGNDYVDVLDMDAVNIKQRLFFPHHSGESIAAFTRKGNKETAAFKKTYQKGEILVLGIGFGHDYDYQLDVVKKIAATIDVSPELTSSNASLSLTERQNDEGTSFFFVHNYDDIEQRGVIYKNGNALFDGKEIMLPARSGAVFVQHLELDAGLKIDMATVELTEFKQTNDSLHLTVTPAGESGMIRFGENPGWKLTSKLRFR